MLLIQRVATRRLGQLLRAPRRASGEVAVAASRHSTLEDGGGSGHPTPARPMMSNPCVKRVKM
jgi:hypothetical protein